MSDREPKCVMCGEYDIRENDDNPEMPYFCNCCGYWGYSPNLTDNPPPEEPIYHPNGQVPHREHAE